MSYTKLTDFAAKDALLSGNPSKLLRGTEIGAEFDAIESAMAAAEAVNITAPIIAASTSKTTPVDADVLPILDSAAANILKKVTWANVKPTLKTYFDTLYATGGLGYGTGSGGTVTQATSKSTAVTLNKPTGLITMASDALTAGVAVSFLVNNSIYALTDVIALTIVGGYSLASNYRCWANHNAAGSFLITIENRSGASLSNAVQLQFAIIKGAAS